MHIAELLVCLEYILMEMLHLQMQMTTLLKDSKSIGKPTHAISSHGKKHTISPVVIFSKVDVIILYIKLSPFL